MQRSNEDEKRWLEPWRKATPETMSLWPRKPYKDRGAGSPEFIFEQCTQRGDSNLGHRVPGPVTAGACSRAAHFGIPACCLFLIPSKQS
jgi:hypothetical protein